MSEIPEGIWRANCCTTVADGKNVSTFNGKWMIGDAFGSKIGYLNEDDMQEFGGQMGLWIQTGIIDDEQKWVSISDITLDMETGVGTVAVTDPQITMEKSHDGATTWSDELSRKLGASGAKSTRVRWNRIGAGRQTVFRFTVTDAVKRIFMGLFGTFHGRSN